MNNSSFCHLHCHGEFSLLDGIGTPKQYATKARELGFSALAVSDHSNVDGALKFIEECGKQEITPVIGCEFYIVPDMTIKEKGDKRGHVCAFVKNEEGWENLLQMLTRANLEGFYRRPRIDYNLLRKHHNGLIISTACTSSFLYLKNGEKFFLDLVDLKKNEDIYLEVMPHHTKAQVDLNYYCLELSDETGVPIIASCDCHYINKEDAKTHEVLLAIQRGAKWEDKNRWRFDPAYEIWFKTADEMLISFNHQGVLSEKDAKVALRRTMEIVKACGDFRIPKKGISLPKPPNAQEEDENEYFRKLCLEGKEKRFGEWPSKEYEERFEYEFRILKDKGFVRYFLIVIDVLNFCKRNNIMYGPGRGSVGGSIIAYITGITNVDPIVYDIPFERFISVDRSDTPDIDLDFEDIKREQIKDYCKGKYGEFNVAAISTFMRMKSKAVIRDVGRVFNADLKAVDKFSKSIKDNIEDALETEEGKTFQKLYPEVILHAKRLEGQCRNNGSHAAGVIISKKDLRNGERCYLANRRDVLTINWDMADCEKVDLIKFDFLGLNNLSVLNEVKRLLKEKDVELVYEDLPLDDPEIYKDVSDGICAGIFQMGYAVVSLTKELRIENFREWADVIALARPGPLDSGQASLYVKRRAGEKWKQKHPIYEEVTKNTYSLCVYQEDIMNVIHKVAGLPYSIANKIRKIIGKKRDASEFEEFKDMFVKGCLKQNTFSEEEANEFWEELQHHSHYSFCRAHAVEYAMLGYWTSYVKHYWPAEFICATLTYGSDSKKQELITEAVKLGLKIVPPRIGKSDPIRWVADGEKLYIPFKEIKGIGEKVCSNLSKSLAVRETKKRKGFLVSEEKVSNFPDLKGKTLQLFEQVGAFNTDEELPTEGEDLFDFKIAKDVKSSYPKLFSILGEDFPERHLQSALEGNVKGLNLFKKRDKPYNIGSELAKCTRCELRTETKKITYPSPSRNNLLLCGEAPGITEEKEGKPFVGKVSSLLWEELKKYGLERKDFYIVNACCCFPSKSRNPLSNHVDACKYWLDKVILNTKPFLVLVLGNMARYAFTGEDKGITKVAGDVIWNEDYGLWVVMCPHPSYVSRNRSEIYLFEKAIQVFSNKITEIGGI